MPASDRDRSLNILLVVALLLTAIGFSLPNHMEARVPKKTANTRVSPGIEEFLERNLNLVKGKNVGLLTHPAGVDRSLHSTLDLLAGRSGIHLAALYGPQHGVRITALFGPEHGVRGNAQAGEYVPFAIDEKYHLPVFSLYGQAMKPDPAMLLNLDEAMRRFDTHIEGKLPQTEMIKRIDVLVIDLQDVGTRVYTYIATMAYCLQACAENGVEVIVLDRPNPINGLDMEGPLLEYPEFSSPVGVYPLPLRHAMTMGELARFFNGEFLKQKAKLTVIPMAGWKRSMWYDQTGLPWVWPSPNMPTLDTATVYPGQVFFEGTNVSEGRGTTRPFETIGAPWIDGNELAAKLNSLNLPGVRFRESWFTPSFSKFSQQLCGGVQLHVSDRRVFRSFTTMLQMIRQLLQMYPQQFRFHEEYFDKIMGGRRIRLQLLENVPLSDIVAGYEKELGEFARRRQPYLLYR